MSATNLTFLFLIESGKEIGTGHLARSLNLARELVHLGSDVKFIEELLDEHGKQKIIGRGFQLISSKTALVESNRSTTACIFDGYGISQMDIDNFTESTFTILFEDFAHRDIESDVLVDANYSNSRPLLFNEQYEHREFIWGARYICLDSEKYTKTKNRSKPAIVIESDNSLLISLGGSDAKKVTERVLGFSKELKALFGKITVVVGPLFGRERVSVIERICDESSVNIAYAPENLALTYDLHSYAIGAAGVSAYERVNKGIPSLNLITEKNQIRVAKNLQSAGLAIALDCMLEGWEQSFMSRVQQLKTDSFRNSVNSLGPKAVDGLGARNLAKKLTDIFYSSESR